MEQFSHIDENGRARMVDVSGKGDTRRVAVAQGEVRMEAETVRRIREHAVAKGDALTVAQTAGILAAKRASELIPMCHPLLLEDIRVALTLGESCVEIEATVATTGKTGVEMEALTAVSVAALTLYDMCKAVDRGMTISEIRLMSKTGGKSDWLRGGEGI
ncbi:MAG: cyclic pyranopterin monophosphate synthase MoaC [Armatimonadetes bacterium]|nr:cyclic pyranopterin monophosphate synthase MoaC [Armatimonadota bacterium]